MRQVGLQNCQHVIAREAGSSKWTELVGAPPRQHQPCRKLKGYTIFSPEYRPSSRDLHTAFSIFASRYLRARTPLRPRIDQSLAAFFKSKEIYALWEEFEHPTSDPKKAALFDAYSALGYLMRPVMYVNGKPRPEEPAWNKANLSGAALEEYEELMAECARFVEAVENDYLARVAAGIGPLAQEIRQLPKTARLGETRPVESAGSAVHDDAKRYGGLAALRAAPAWTMTKEGWTADVEIHSCADRFTDVREEVEKRLGPQLGCGVNVLDQGGPYLCARLTVPPPADVSANPA